MDIRPTRTTMSLLQGFYYTLTGIWPLISMETFLAVTGPKTDLWLVRTVSLLITAIGLTLLAAWKAREVTGSIMFLAVGSALGLTWVDVYYSMEGVIWPVYLLDAVGEGVLILGWLIARRRDYWLS
jgi:hypothetical protein